jgi:hypothetical protein
VSLGALLARIVEQLDRAGIPHMIAGSFASTYHGVARSTHDIDFVIDPSEAGVRTFVAGLPEADYYVDAEAAVDAVRRRSQFNVIDMETGWKLDFIVRKDRPFSVEEMRRRQAADLFGTRVFVATAEDSIIAKLEWARLGDSERQLRDAAGIVAVRAAELDRSYLDGWVVALGLEAQWSVLEALASSSC